LIGSKPPSSRGILGSQLLVRDLAATVWFAVAGGRVWRLRDQKRNIVCVVLQFLPTLNVLCRVVDDEERRYKAAFGLMVLLESL
jgi:hypothetical protein